MCHVTIGQNENLQPDGAPGQVELANGTREYTGTFSARCGNGWPVPVRQVLCIDLHHKAWGLWTLTIPVVVWPSLNVQISWVLGIVLLLIGGKFLSVWESKDYRLADVITQMTADYRFWGWMGGLALVLFLFIWLFSQIGWVFLHEPD